MTDKQQRPDVNDTLRAEGIDAVRERHDSARTYLAGGNGHGGDGKGELFYHMEVLRKELAQPKDEQRSIYLCATIKDCDALAALSGGQAITTTSMGGLRDWKPECADLLRDTDVVILGTNDDASKAEVRLVAASLDGVAARVRVLSWPDHWQFPPKGAGLTAWLDKGKGNSDAFYKIVDKLKTWAPIVHAKPFSWPDPAAIPPRQFLFDRHYVRGSVGATIGGGGRAKTSKIIAEAVSMSCGKNLFTGEPLKEPLRVWLLNAEEEQAELDRRVTAACRFYGVTKDDCGGRLFVQSVRNIPMRLATIMSRNTPLLNRELLGMFETEIRGKRIDVLMLDPLISFHSLAENLNEHMDVLIKEGLGGVADRTRSAIELSHHTGKLKPGQAETSVEDARGASGIIWAVRSARVLNFMTPDEAKELGIAEKERRLHIRVTNGKANAGPIGTASWFRLHLEDLPNGDQVACSTPWKPPDPFRGVSTEVLHKCRRLVQGGAYRYDSQAKNWVGYLIADLLKINVIYGAENAEADLIRVKHILKTWITNKVLATDKRADENRRERVFIIPGPWEEDSTASPSEELDPF